MKLKYIPTYAHKLASIRKELWGFNPQRYVYNNLIRTMYEHIRWMTVSDLEG